MQTSNPLIIADGGAGDLAVQLDSLRGALAKATTFADVQGVRDRARVIADATRRIAALREAHQQAVEIDVRATRRTGEELIALDQDKVGRERVALGIPTLAELGLKSKESIIARSIAKIPAAEFETWIDQAREHHTFSVWRCYLASRAIRGKKPYATSPQDHGAEKATLDRKYSKAPTNVTIKHLLQLLQDSLRRLLPRFDPVARRKFLTQLRDLIAAEEARAAAGAPGRRFDDDPKAARREPRLVGRLPPATDPKC